MLVTASGRTLYHDSSEKKNVVKCLASCASQWPPLLVAPGAKPVPGPGVTASLLGTVKRPDGKLQVTYAGLPLEKLPATGKAFIRAFSKYLKLPAGELPPPYSVYQAQGAQIMLNAIAHSNGTRADVNAKMFATSVRNGIIAPL